MSLLILTALLAANAGFDPNSFWFDRTSNLDCPAKEGGFVYEARVDRYVFEVFTDAAGVPLHVHRVNDECAAAPAGKPAPSCARAPAAAAKALWDKAEPAGPSRASRTSACGRQGWGWETNNPTPYDEETFADGTDYTLSVKKLKIKLRAEAADGAIKGCKDLRMLAASGANQLPVAEDRCRPGDEAYGDVTQWTVQNAVTAAEDRIALSLVAERYPARKAPGGKGDDPRTRARVVVIDRRTFLGVDLLDAGAGARLDQLATRVTSAGFRVLHRGKAKTPRTTTDVYYAADFEAEAREVAKAIGVPNEAVQPLSWKSPYPITVAAGTK
jgi:hypothetical protein